MTLDEEELRQSARLVLGQCRSRDDLWADLKGLGWPALTAPDSAGGLEQPFAAAAWLHEEVGRALAPMELAGSLLAIEALRQCPISDARDRWMERIASGQPVLASLAGPAPVRGAAGASAGSLEAVTGAHGTRHALVVLETEQLFGVLDLDLAGVKLEAQDYWDETRILGRLELPTDCRASIEVLAEADAAHAVRDAMDSHLHFALAADSIGLSLAFFENAVEFLKTRRQFGRPLAMFQALKHRCADLAAELTAAQALLAHEAATHPPGSSGSVEAARALKAFATRTAHHVAEEAMQFHGGVSMTVEYDCHRYLKRALLNAQLGARNEASDIRRAEGLLRSPMGRAG